MSTYTGIVEADPEDAEGAVLTFPEELIAEVGWTAGDSIKWSDNNDGSWTLTKIEK